LVYGSTCWAVELRRDESRRRLEDLVRPPQLSNSFFNSPVSAKLVCVLPLEAAVDLSVTGPSCEWVFDQICPFAEDHGVA